jgi:acyl-CoA thioester hydrolase
MSRQSPVARVRLVVPFHDCDPLQVVWHGRYLEYFELARTELFATRGLDVPHFRELGYKMYVSEVRCRYTHPLSYGDQAEVTARPTALRPLLRIAYSITNLTRKRRSARGFTVLAVTDLKGRLLPETPDAIIRRLSA